MDVFDVFGKGWLFDGKVFPFHVAIMVRMMDMLNDYMSRKAAIRNVCGLEMYLSTESSLNSLQIRRVLQMDTPFLFPSWLPLLNT